MSVWEHSRFKIFNPGQHPLKHDLSDFAYSNPRVPGVGTFMDALDYIVAVLYPNYIGTFATKTALPVSANRNDYAFVSDDGDGKSAGYVWSVIDSVAQWIKRYDVDWALESILAETVTRTQYVYASKYGMDDKDALNAPITGIFAGQSIFGGESANTNLTLHANSGDAPGTRTGAVQTNDDFLPTVHDLLSLGSNGRRFRYGYFQQGLVTGTVQILSGSITDSSGTLSFGNNNLSSTGLVSVGVLSVADSATVGTLTLDSGLIFDSSGTISFGSSILNDIQQVQAGSVTVGGTLGLESGGISDSSGSISFASTNLSTTGSVSTGALTATRLDVDSIRVDGSAISVQTLNGGLSLSANGTGLVEVLSPLSTVSQSITGTASVNGLLTVDQLTLDGSEVSASGDLRLTPGGSGKLILGGRAAPATHASFDLGESGVAFRKAYLSGAIVGPSFEVQVSDLEKLRNAPFRDSARTQAAQTGDVITWDGSQFLAASTAGTISHAALTGLASGDAGHTQFAMLTGRAGGQSLQGGTAASENLTLESTANATKGRVLTKDTFGPATDASFSGGWQGTDLGAASHQWRDVYARGVYKNFRFESATSSTLPANSAQNVGRAVYATDNGKVYIDTGTTWATPQGGASKFLQDLSFTASDTLKTVTVSGAITDARQAIWQLCDNANDFERMFVSIKATSATQVQISLNSPLPAGTYRLIGIE